MKALLLDDDGDLLEVIADLLRANNCQCLLARSVDSLKALGPQALNADVAVLDINLGARQPSGLDANEWLISHDFRGRILFLTGHARTHPLVARAQSLHQARVLDKPMGAKDLVNAILGVG